MQSGGSYRVEFRRVAYDVEAVVSQLFAVGHPAAQVQTYNFQTARPPGESLIYTSEMRRGHALSTAKTAARPRIWTSTQPLAGASA